MSNNLELINEVIEKANATLAHPNTDLEIHSATVSIIDIWANQTGITVHLSKNDNTGKWYFYLGS